MKLVCGDQVVDTNSVTIMPSRLSHHDEPGRIKQLVELTVPADAQLGGYAVRQLLGQDPDIQAKAVVTLEVALTSQQIDRLKNITEEELREIRNGVNPAMIYGVRVYDVDPLDVEEFITGKKWPRWFMPVGTLRDAFGKEIICIRKDSDHDAEIFHVGGSSVVCDDWNDSCLSLEKIDEQEAMALIEHSRKQAAGQYHGVVQWFQHTNPNVIVRRDSHNRSTYFERDLPPASDVSWTSNMSKLVESGQWAEITQQEADRRIEYNRKFAGLTAQEPQPGLCKREQFAGGGAPSPRSCDVCQEGPCPLVITGSSQTAEDPAMKCLQNLARQCGIDPAGMTAENLGDLIVEHNQKKADRIEPVVLPDPQSYPIAIVPVDGMHRWGGTYMIRLSKEQAKCVLGGGSSGPIEKWHGENDPFNGTVWKYVTVDQAEQMRLEYLQKNADEAESIALQSEALQKAEEPKPIPRNIPNLAFVGVDWGKGPSSSATVCAVTGTDQPQIFELTMQSVLTPGLWVVAFQTKEHFLVEVGHDRTRELEHPIPAAKISGPIGVKLPLQNRIPQMPKDYGKQVYFRSPENFDQCEVSSGILQGFHSGKNQFIVASDNRSHLSYVREGDIWIIDEPTEGF